MRHVSIILLLMFSIGSSKSKSAETLPAGNATSDFWTWFASRSAEYARLFSYEQQAAAADDLERQKQVKQAVADTAARLRRINQEFSPFFGYSGGTNKLIITVGGKEQLFAAVDRFVSAAPKIANWTFIALKSPLNLNADTEIKSGSVTLKLGDMRYIREPKGNGSFAFTVFIPSNVSSDPEGFRRLCTRLLEDSLGERLAATAIQSVEVRKLETTPQTGLLEFIHVHRDVASKGSAVK